MSVTMAGATPRRPSLLALAAVMVAVAGCDHGPPPAPSSQQVSLVLGECLFRAEAIKDKLAPAGERPLSLLEVEGGRVSSSCEAAIARLVAMGAPEACVKLGRVNMEVGAQAELLFAAADADRNEARLKTAIGDADAAAKACPITGA